MRVYATILALVTVSCVTPLIPDDELARSAAKATAETCGATFSVTGGNMWGSRLYAVGAYPEPGRGEVLSARPTEATIRAFIEKHRALLSAPRHALGVYCDSPSAKGCDGEVTCYLDITRLTPSLDTAVTLARACNQKSIALLEQGGIILIDSHDGAPLGSGEALAGADLAGCERARQSR